MTEDVTIAADDPTAPDVQALLVAHEREMSVRYGGTGEPSGKDPTVHEQFTDARGGIFVVARRDRRAIAIAGVRTYADGVAEIKRMYVVPDHRGRGLGRRMLAALERWAHEEGFERIILETGTAQPEACSLYESEGFSRIEPYGVWRDSPDSICYEKELGERREGKTDGRWR